MANKPALNSEPPRRKRGRPTREEEVRRALAESLGVDPSSIDPRKILAGIAADLSAPAGARVAACKVLLNLDPAAEDSAAAADDVAARAIRLMAAARKAH
jgi:hypothetical protein